MENARRVYIEEIANGMVHMKRIFLQKKWHDKDGPTHAQLGILILIAHEGACTPKVIARKLAISPSAATQLIAGLEKQNLLMRKQDKFDGRKITLVLSKKGKNTLEKIKRIRLEQMETLFKPLSDKELMQLSRLHQKIVKNYV